MLRPFMVLALLLIGAGCETTGDPNEGGLFGWSEQKAKDRQNERQVRLQAVGEEARDEEAKLSQAENKLVEVQGELLANDLQLTSLMNETHSLQGEIEGLLEAEPGQSRKRDKLAESLAQINANLFELNRKIQTGERDRERYLEELRVTNRAYTDAIIRFLK